MADLNKAMYNVLMAGMISSTIIYILGMALLFFSPTYVEDCNPHRHAHRESIRVDTGFRTQ